MSTHKELVTRATEAINAVFSDTSVSQEDSLASLEELTDLLTASIDAIRTDIDRRNEEEDERRG